MTFSPAKFTTQVNSGKRYGYQFHILDLKSANINSMLIAVAVTVDSEDGLEEGFISY